MMNNFQVNMDEYLPLRDVVFKTLRQAIYISVAMANQKDTEFMCKYYEDIFSKRIAL